MTKDEEKERVKVPQSVRESDFGCHNCLWAGVECKNGSKYVPSMPIYDEPSCDAYVYCD